MTAAHKQLSLRGLLHYLWERAGFNRWYPAMEGKRSYGVVRKYLLQACEEIETKGLRLAERVFMPQPFVAERAAQTASGHRAALALLARKSNSRCNLMVAIGELKTLAPAPPLGHRVLLKHLPDCPLFIDTNAGERLKRVFDRELMAWASGQVKLVVACLIQARDDCCYVIHELTVMMTNPQWIPLEDLCEAAVVAKLVAERRAFIRPLRYDAADAARFPNLLLLDAGGRAVALDMLSAFASEADRAAKLEAIGRREPRGWVWDTARDTVPPAFPATRASVAC